MFTTTDDEPPLSGRGSAVMLKHGGLPESLSPYLIEQIKRCDRLYGPDKNPFRLQFVARTALEQTGYDGDTCDPLLEDENEVAPGLVYKYRAGTTPDGVRYSGRVLFTISRICGSYCRYCTRGRQVGIPPGVKGPSKGALSNTLFLSIPQIDTSLAYIKANPEIDEVIVSGGDPLVSPPNMLSYLLGKLRELQDSGQLHFVRIGTRLPIHNPRILSNRHYEAIKQLRNPFIMLHINHSEELTEETLRAILRFRTECNADLFSQSVFLNGVNDDPQVLYDLFKKCRENHITPYYLYQNDPVPWAQHFTIPPQKAVKIWQSLYGIQSGITSTVRFVIDTPNGHGKVALPMGGFATDFSKYSDYHGNEHLFIS